MPSSPRRIPLWSDATERGRRAILVMLLVAALAIAGSYWVGRAFGAPAAGAPAVGADLHAVFTHDGRFFVSGHGGAAYQEADGRWHAVPSLADRDAMAWAATPRRLLVGGHANLYVSDDAGTTFRTSRSSLAGQDVHALGAAAGVVIASTPNAGIYTSRDGGQTFVRRGSEPGLMGTIFVDPRDPTRAIGADMRVGAVATSDGGRSWHALGGPVGAMSVAVRPGSPDEITVLGTGGAARSDDGGKTWTALQVPPNTTTATYNADGELVVAALSGWKALTYRLVGGQWRETT